MAGSPLVRGEEPSMGQGLTGTAVLSLSRIAGVLAWGGMSCLHQMRGLH